MNKITHVVLILIVLALLSACQPGQDPSTPPGVDGEYTYGEDAIIDSLEVLLMESFPVQARVRVLGNLPDGCTELHEITVEREGQKFILTLTTRRPAGDIACTEALVPFEESVSLDIEGLEAGTYTVIAQDEQTAFTLDMDNAIP
jgi:inhibitor of cysteine peptidase